MLLRIDGANPQPGSFVMPRSITCLLTLLALLTASALPGQVVPFEFYYRQVDTTDAATLRSTLHATIRNHRRIAYDSGANWPILEQADRAPSDGSLVLDFYRNDLYAAPASRGTDYNREHIWPQSYGFPSSVDNSTGQGFFPRTDMHSLYLANSSYNSTRGNRWFDTALAPRTIRATVENFGAGGGAEIYPGNHNWFTNSGGTWEMWNGRRGDAARALFYMDVRYAGGMNGNGTTPEPNLVLTNDVGLIQPTTDSVAYMGRLSVLLEWNQQDPPDVKELLRMEVIANAQGNRNPFVDFPMFADCLFNGDCSAVPPMTPQNVLALAGPESTTVRWAPRPDGDLAGYHVYTATDAAGPFARATASPVAGVSYRVTGLADGVTYYFAVRAIDLDGNESPNSWLASAVPGPRTVLLAESFEEPPSPGSYTITGGIGQPRVDDYYDRFNELNKPTPLQVATSGADQFWFIAGEDTNGTAPLPADGIHTVTLAPVSADGFTDFEVSLLLNARDAAVYDSPNLASGDYLRVFASWDGGNDVLIGQFCAMGPGTGSNRKLGLDTNLDGIGDIEIADYTRLSRYAFAVPGLGNSLTVKVITRFEAGGEQIVFDDVRVSALGDAPSSAPGWWLVF